MTPETLESIRKKAESFPVLTIVEEKWVAYGGEEIPSNDYMLKKENTPGGQDKYLGDIEAHFPYPEAEFIADARGDILALVAEVERLRQLVPGETS